MPGEDFCGSAVQSLRDRTLARLKSWGFNTIGWVLVLTPWIVFALGLVVGAIRRQDENEDAIKDLVT